MTEISFRPNQAMGPDLSYRDKVAVSGHITPKQLKQFVKARRNNRLGTTTLYYAGVVGPAISAGTFKLFENFFSNYNLSPQMASLLPLIFAASAGLSWFAIFTRLAQREKNGRDDENSHELEIDIDNSGLTVKRKFISSRIDWPAIVDIRITKHYIAFIVEGANDFIIPVSWFEDREKMTEAARKISALRPPPFKA